MQPSIVGINLKRLRESQQLTQRALAEKAGISHAHIAQIESGHRQEPHVKTLQRLKEPLGATLEDFFQRQSHQTHDDTKHQRDGSDEPGQPAMEGVR